jgi:hypothetical protein
MQNVQKCLVIFLKLYVLFEFVFDFSSIHQLPVWQLSIISLVHVCVPLSLNW